jgi:hypothetical protein
VHAQLQALASNPSAKPLIESYDKRLSEAIAPLSEAQGHIESLYKEVVRADAAPTAAQIGAKDAALTKVMPQFDNWSRLQTELPALNKSLRSAGLAPVRPELAAPRDLNVADEE